MTSTLSSSTIEADSNQVNTSLLYRLKSVKSSLIKPLNSLKNIGKGSKKSNLPSYSFACFYNSPNNLWHYGHLLINIKGIQYNFKGKNIIPGAGEGIDLSFNWNKIHHFRKVKASNKPSFSKGIEWLDGMDRHLFIFIQDRDKIWEKINKVAILANYKSWSDEEGVGLGLGINNEEDNTSQRTSTDNSGNGQLIYTSPDQLSSKTSTNSITSGPSSPTLTGQQGIIYELNSQNRGFLLDGFDTFPSTPLTTSSVTQFEESKSTQKKPEIVFQDTFPCQLDELFNYIFSNNHKFTELAHIKHCRNKPLSTLKSPNLSEKKLYEFEDPSENSILSISNPITKLKYKSMVKYSKWVNNYRTISYPMPLTSRHPLLKKLHDSGYLKGDNFDNFINIEEKQKLDEQHPDHISVLGQGIINLDRVPREFYLKYTLESIPPEHTQLTIKLMMKEDFKPSNLDPYYKKWIEDNFRLLSSHLSQFILKNIYKKSTFIPPTPEIQLQKPVLRSSSQKLPPKRPNSEILPPVNLNLNAFKRNSTIVNNGSLSYLEKPQSNQNSSNTNGGRGFRLTQNPIDLSKLLNSRLNSGSSPMRAKSLPLNSNLPTNKEFKSKLIKTEDNTPIDEVKRSELHMNMLSSNNNESKTQQVLSEISSTLQSSFGSGVISIESNKVRIDSLEQNANIIFLLVLIIFIIMVKCYWD